MAKVNLFAAAPPSTVYDADNPTRQTEFLSWVLSTNLVNMQATGFVLDDGNLTAIELDKVTAAQQRLTATLTDFLSSLEPGKNTEAGRIITNFAHLLDLTNQLSPSLTGLGVLRKTLAELPVILSTIDRSPSKEEIDFLKEADTYATKFETFFSAGMTALYDKETAESALEAAKQLLAAAITEEDVTAANAAVTAAEGQVTAAEGEMTAAQNQLPIDTLPQKMVALMLIIRAVMRQDFLAVGIILIRVFIPILIDYIVKWVGGKLPGKKPPTIGDLQPIVDALHDLALKETTLRFGDDASLHTKAGVLEF